MTVMTVVSVTWKGRAGTKWRTRTTAIMCIGVVAFWGRSAKRTRSGGEDARKCCPERILLPDSSKMDVFNFNFGSTVFNTSVYRNIKALQWTHRCVSVVSVGTRLYSCQILEAILCIHQCKEEIAEMWDEKAVSSYCPKFNFLKSVEIDTAYLPVILFHLRKVLFHLWRLLVHVY